MGRERVAPAHVLIALALSKEEVGLVLHQQGVDPDAVRNLISEGTCWSERLIQNIAYDDHAREMAVLALDFSTADKLPEVSNAHILKALLVEDARCSVVEMLKSLDVDLETLRRRTEIILKLSNRPDSVEATKLPESVRPVAALQNESTSSESKLAIHDVFDDATVSVMKIAQGTARALGDSLVRLDHLLAAFGVLGFWRQHVDEIMTFVRSEHLLSANLIAASVDDDSPIEFADDIKDVLLVARELSKVNTRGLIEPVMMLYGMVKMGSPRFFKDNQGDRLWQFAASIRQEILNEFEARNKALISEAYKNFPFPGQAGEQPLLEPVYLMLTERLVRVLRIAKAEAELLHHPFVEAPHLVLAMIRESFFSEVKFVKDREIDVEKLKEDVSRVCEALTPSVTLDELSSTIKLAPKSRGLLLLARDQARELRLSYIDLNHLAIALLEAEDWLRPLVADSKFSNAAALVKRLKQCSFLQHHVLQGERGSSDLPVWQTLTLDDIDARLEPYSLEASRLLPAAAISIEERLDPRARVVMGYAVEESRKFGHSRISIATIMLGLLYETFGPTFQVFNVLDLNLLESRQILAVFSGRNSVRAAALRPLSHNALRVMECGWRFAQLMKSNLIAPEHILLAMAEESEGVASFVCEALSIDGKVLRTELIAAMNEPDNYGNSLSSDQPLSGITVETNSERINMDGEDYDVSKTDDGRVLILTDTYAASFVDGKWHRKVAFKTAEIQEDFMTVDNPTEAKRLRDEAVKALNLSA